jgi:hypothetical protein
MATATKTTRVVSEFTLVLTEQEARELVFYLAARPADKDGRQAAVKITDDIYAAVNGTLY